MNKSEQISRTFDRNFGLGIMQARFGINRRPSFSNEELKGINGLIGLVYPELLQATTLPEGLQTKARMEQTVVGSESQIKK